MNQQKTRVQIIGNYLDPLERLLNGYNIAVDSCIAKCNPLAMIGKTDDSYLKYAEDPEANFIRVLNIKKNLNQMLSRNSDNFCQNYNKQPVGKEVRDKNETSYLIFSNAGIALNLFEKNGILFSYSWPEDDFIKALKDDKGYRMLSFPFPEDFNVKYYYDKFIDTITAEYDKDHIILIKTNSSQWYMNEKDIATFDSRSSKVRKYISDLDEYFTAVTHCLVIDEEYNHIPSEKIPCSIPYVQKNTEVFEKITERLCDIITNGNSARYMPLNYRKDKSFISSLYSKLSEDTINSESESLETIERDWLSLSDIKAKNLTQSNVFFSDIYALKDFVDPKTERTLSDYVIKKMAAPNYTFNDKDLYIAQKYTKNMKLNINDLIAVYVMSQNCGNKLSFKEIAQNICKNSGSLPVKAAMQQKKSNIDYLKKYPYINFNSEDINSSAVYICLKNGVYLVLDPDDVHPIKKVNIDYVTELDFNRIIENNYTCSVLEADALTYSIDYYVQKAKNNCGNKPTYLKFDSEEEFYSSLNYIDYPVLLENERFAFDIAGRNDVKIKDYSPVTNLTELLDKDTANVFVGYGLGDQFGYYLLGQFIQEFSGRKVIYNDINCYAFNGFEIKRFAKKPMNLLSNKVSKRIKKSAGTNAFNTIYTKISPQFTFVTSSYEVWYKKLGYGSPCFFTSNLYQAVTTSLPYSYYHYHLFINKAVEHFSFNLRDNIEFPEFTEERHKALSQKMLSCDAVVIHIRLGDYIKMGWAADNSYYVDKISKVMGLKQYSNKKFFVFSDDIKWCEEHKAEVGLDQVEDCEVVFVEGNKYENSFRDIQLMALGKIMIIGTSYFSKIAALYNDRWEMFFSNDNAVCEHFKKFVRKNKYEIK